MANRRFQKILLRAVTVAEVKFTDLDYQGFKSRLDTWNFITRLVTTVLQKGRKTLDLNIEFG